MSSGNRIASFREVAKSSHSPIGSYRFFKRVRERPVRGQERHLLSFQLPRRRCTNPSRQSTPSTTLPERSPKSRRTSISVRLILAQPLRCRCCTLVSKTRRTWQCLPEGFECRWVAKLAETEFVVAFPEAGVVFFCQLTDLFPSDSSNNVLHFSPANGRSEKLVIGRVVEVAKTP